MTFNRLITQINRTVRTDKKNEWVVIHYVGAVSSAENNAKYFNTAYRGASAHYFVDEKSIWQVVEDKDDAWHVGGAKKYYNTCRNNNSIGIELCCKKDKQGNWYFEKETIDNAVWLTAEILKKYGLNVDQNLTTHYLTTHKNCPEPFVRDPAQWENFKERVQSAMSEKELTMQEKLKEIQRIAILDDNTGNYFSYYRHNVPLIDKLYQLAVDAEKWRNLAKN